MKGFPLIAGSFVVLALASAAPAQDNRASDTINVIGRKPEEVRQEAKDFVRVTGVAERPVARWIDPICPKALEVSKEIAVRVEARVREVAHEAGARVAEGSCAPNLKIVFTNAADTLLRDVRNKSGDIFADLDGDSRAILYGRTAPVRWWHTIQERTKDGMRPMASDTPPAAGMDVGSGAISLGGLVHQQYRSSFLGTQMMRGIIASKVVIDVNLAEGVPLDSVAAFAALVGLAEIQLDEETPPASILSLFAEGGPRDLTPLDTNFLRTLYQLPLDRTARMQRGLLIRGLVAPPKR